MSFPDLVPSFSTLMIIEQKNFSASGRRLGTPKTRGVLDLQAYYAIFLKVRSYAREAVHMRPGPEPDPAAKRKRTNRLLSKRQSPSAT